MDKAIEIIPKSSMSRLVSAREINRRFRGDVPKAIRFKCPYCNRPVNDYAMYVPQSGQNPRIQKPHFRHRKGDPWTHACPEHSAGAGAIAMMFHTAPILPIFLRRRQGRVFEIELSIRAHPAGHEGNITLDGRPFRLTHENRLRYERIPLSSPDAALSGVTVPESMERSIGYVENGCDILVFSDIYGSEGGRRIGKESALHPDRDYYIVATERALKHIDECFDRVTTCGYVASKHRLLVLRVRVGSESAKCDAACRWLYRRGFTLSEIDMAAHPIWPPTLRSSGVDEPLFSQSEVVYKTPYSALSNPDSDIARTVNYNTSSRTRTRMVSVLGLDGASTVQRELEGDCLFVRFNRYQAWNALITTMTGARGLEPMPLDEARKTGQAVLPFAPKDKQSDSAPTGEQQDLQFAAPEKNTKKLEEPYEVIDIPFSHDLGRIAIELDRGIRYSGDVHNQVLIRYEDKGVNYSHAILLDANDLLSVNGRLKLAPTARAYANDFIIRNSKVHRSASSDNMKQKGRMLYSRSKRAPLRPCGRVQIRVEFKLFDQYLDFFQATYPEMDIRMAVNQRYLRQYFGDAVRKSDISDVKKALARRGITMQVQPRNSTAKSDESFRKALAKHLLLQGILAPTDDELHELSAGITASIVSCDAIIAETGFAERIANAAACLFRKRPITLRTETLEDVHALHRLVSEATASGTRIIIPTGSCSSELLHDAETWTNAFFLPTWNLKQIEPLGKAASELPVPPKKQAIPTNKLMDLRKRLSSLTARMIDDEHLNLVTEVLAQRLEFGQNGAGKWVWPHLFALILSQYDESIAMRYASSMGRAEEGKFIIQMMKGDENAR